MSKGTIKTVIITIICTLLVIGGIGAVAIPKVIDKVKVEAVANFSDEYDEIAFILDQSKEPVIQENYIITGLIMSPDFREYLDEGVQNGWWTKSFLEQFLIDEALPIFFTNYHALFSVILGSEPVQEAGEKVTIIKAEVQELIAAIKAKVGHIGSIINNNQDKIAAIKSVIGQLQANSGEIANLIATLKSIDFAGIQSSIANIKGALGNIDVIIANLQNIVGQLQDIKGKIDSIDPQAIQDAINDINTLITQIQSLDKEKLAETIEQLKEIIAKIESIDKEKLAETIEQLKETIAMIESLDIDQIKATINTVIEFINKIENGGFDGVLGDILNSILNSDEIQDILNNIDNTLETVKKLVDIWFNKVIDIDTTNDYNWNNFGKFDADGNGTIDSKYVLIAQVLNTIDLEIPKDGYVYDDNGTKVNTKDDVLTINIAYVGFEIDGEPTTNVLSSPIEITGSQALLAKGMISTINNKI